MLDRRFEESGVGRYLEARESVVNIVNVSSGTDQSYSLRDVVGCLLMVLLYLGWGFALGCDGCGVW